MNEPPLDELLPQGHQDMLNAYHEYMAQASDIGNQITESDMKTLHLPLKAKWYEMIESGVKTEEYLQWEKEAIEKGYKKYNTTSSSNDYSYFKTIGKTDEGYKYMIEWRVWDWHKYIGRDPSLAERPYSLEVNIIPDSCKYDRRLDFMIGHPLKFGFDKIEIIAEHFHQFLVDNGLAVKKEEQWD